MYLEKNGFQNLRFISLIAGSELNIKIDLTVEWNNKLKNNTIKNYGLFFFFFLH